MKLITFIIFISHLIISQAWGVRYDNENHRPSIKFTNKDLEAQKIQDEYSRDYDLPENIWQLAKDRFKPFEFRLYTSNNDHSYLPATSTVFFEDGKWYYGVFVGDQQAAILRIDISHALSDIQSKRFDSYKGSQINTKSSLKIKGQKLEYSSISTYDVAEYEYDIELIERAQDRGIPYPELEEYEKAKIKTEYKIAIEVKGNDLNIEASYIHYTRQADSKNWVIDAVSSFEDPRNMRREIATFAIESKKPRTLEEIHSFYDSIPKQEEYTFRELNYDKLVEKDYERVDNLVKSEKTKAKLTNTQSPKPKAIILYLRDFRNSCSIFFE